MVVRWPQAKESETLPAILRSWKNQKQIFSGLLKEVSQPHCAPQRQEHSYHRSKLPGMVVWHEQMVQSSMIVLVSSTIQHCLSVAFQFSKPKPGKVWWEDWLGWGVLSRWASHQQAKVLGLWLRRAEGTHDCGHSRRGMFFWKIFSCQSPMMAVRIEGMFSNVQGSVLFSYICIDICPLTAYDQHPDWH